MTYLGKSTRRRRVAVALVLATVGAVGLGLAWSRRDPWPPRRVFRLASPTSIRAISGDGRWLVTYGPGQSGTYTDLMTGQPRPDPPAASIPPQTYSRDRRTFVGTNGLSSVAWCDTASGTIKASFAADPLLVQGSWFADEDRQIRTIARVKDRYQISVLVSWDLASGTETRRPFTGPAGLGPTKFLVDGSPDRRLLAFLDRTPNQLQLWDSEAECQFGDLLAAPDIPPTGGLGLAWTPDNRTLILARLGGQVELRDLAGSPSVRTFRIHSTGFRTDSLSVSPDGRLLASGGFLANPANWAGRAWSSFRRTFSTGWDSQSTTEVVVIDLASGQRVARLAGAVEPVFSPDGRSFVTRGVDGTYTVRDAPRPIDP